MIFLVEQSHNSESISTVLGNSLVILISFILLLAILQKFAMKPIMKIVEERQNKINKDLDDAQNLQQQAQLQEKQAQAIVTDANNQARQILLDAKSNSEKFVEEQRLAAKEELATMRAQAQVQIEKEREEMMATLQKEVANVSVDLAKKILKREVTVEDHQKIIDDFIDNLD